MWTMGNCGTYHPTPTGGLGGHIGSQHTNNMNRYPLFNLHEPQFYPTCPILIRGEKSSGVSTLFNFLFQQPTRPINSISGHDEPMIANITNIMKIKGEEKSPDNEIDYPYHFLSDLFPNSLNETIHYKFIDSGNLSSEWFQQWTKYFAGIIFVIDRDRLQQEVSYTQRQALISTLKDLKDAKIRTGYNIPLLIVINKVEELDDPVMLQNRERFEWSLNEYLNLTDFSVNYHFVCMSSLNASLYRQFSLNGNFNDMSQHDIIRFCGMELGSEGKIRARDLANHVSLVEDLKHRILSTEGRSRWLNLTGASSFLEWFESSVFPMTLLYKCLFTQLSSLLFEVNSVLQPKTPSKSNGTKNAFSSSPSLQPTTSFEGEQLDKFRGLLKLFVIAHTNYSRIAEVKNQFHVDEDSKNSQRDFRALIQKVCRDNYEQNMTKVIDLTLSTSNGGSGESARLSLILKMLSEHKSIDQYHLIPDDLWENGKINTVMIVLERLWSNNLEKPFSFTAPMDYSFNSVRSPNAQGAVNSVSMTIEAIKHVYSSGSSEFITNIVEKVLIPLIDTLRIEICRVPLDSYITRVLLKKPSKTDAIDLVSSDSSRSSSPNHESDSHLLWGSGQRFAIMKLEECAHMLLHKVLHIKPQIRLLESIIKKKISIRESLSGYTICLKEFLEKYPSFKELKFFMFCAIIHSPVPQGDAQWAINIPEQTNYSNDILNSPFLRSEIMLRDILATAPPLTMASSISLSSMPPPFIKSEPDCNVRSNSPKLERADSIKRKRTSSSSSNVEEVAPPSPDILTVSPPSTPRVTPVKLTPSRRRLVIGGGEC